MWNFDNFGIYCMCIVYTFVYTFVYTIYICIYICILYFEMYSNNSDVDLGRVISNCFLCVKVM